MLQCAVRLHEEGCGGAFSQRTSMTVPPHTASEPLEQSGEQGYPIDSTSLYLWCFWVVGAANEHLIRNRRHLHCLLCQAVK